MKKYSIKRYITYMAIATLVLSAGLAFAANSALTRDFGRQLVQVFCPNEVIAVDNGALAVSTYRVIMFNDIVNVQINGAGLLFSYPANTPIGIGTDVTSMTISGLGSATTALVM